MSFILSESRFSRPGAQLRSNFCVKKGAVKYSQIMTSDSIAHEKKQVYMYIHLKSSQISTLNGSIPILSDLSPPFFPFLLAPPSFDAQIHISMMQLQPPGSSLISPSHQETRLTGCWAVCPPGVVVQCAAAAPWREPRPLHCSCRPGKRRLGLVGGLVGDPGDGSKHQGTWWSLKVVSSYESYGYP